MGAKITRNVIDDLKAEIARREECANREAEMRRGRQKNEPSETPVEDGLEDRLAIVKYEAIGDALLAAERALLTLGVPQHTRDAVVNYINALRE